MGQIARLTGVSKGTVSKTIQKMNPEAVAERRFLMLHEPDVPDYEFGIEAEIW